METHNHQIGIEINIHHINVILVFQQNKQWKIESFWQFPLPLSGNINEDNLRNILINWRKQLPFINNVAVSLPHIYESYQITSLPHSISLTPAARYRLAQLRATTYEQSSKKPVSFDYRQNRDKFAIHLYQKVMLDKYLALFSKVGLTISAIDIPACALRYLANYLHIPSQSVLIYCENKTLFWVCPDKDMPSYGTLTYHNKQDQQTCLQQLVEKNHWSLTHCYFAGDNAEYFSHLMPTWPNYSHSLFQNNSKIATLSFFALGLALRPWERLCIK